MMCFLTHLMIVADRGTGCPGHLRQQSGALRDAAQAAAADQGVQPHTGKAHSSTPAVVWSNVACLAPDLHPASAY